MDVQTDERTLINIESRAELNLIVEQWPQPRTLSGTWSKSRFVSQIQS